MPLAMTAPCQAYWNGRRPEIVPQSFLMARLRFLLFELEDVAVEALERLFGNVEAPDLLPVLVVESFSPLLH